MAELEAEEAKADTLPPPSPGGEKRTSWVNENFDDVALFDEEGEHRTAATSERTADPARGSPTTALSTVVGEAYVENKDNVSASDGALLEVEAPQQQAKPSSHRTLPAPPTQPRPSSAIIKLKNSLLRPLDDTSHYDLQVSVNTREKHVVSKTDSYFIYQVVTKCSRPGSQYTREEYTVWRRYRDFVWLHGMLERTYPTLIVPPLPGKQLTRYFDHQSDQFLSERQKGLGKFLWRLAIHPFFSYDDNLCMFLTSPTEAFASHVAETSTGNKLLGYVSTSVKQATTSLKLKEPNPDFAKASKYFANFSEKTGVLERIETRLHAERNGLSEAIQDLATPIFSWGNSEPYLSGCISKLASVFESSSTSLNGLNESNTLSFLMAMKEYHLYAESALSALRRRDSLQLEYEMACDERSKRKKAHEDAALAGKTEKVEKLAMELSSAGVVAETALDKLTQANEQLRVDIEKWHEAKNIQWSAVMREWAGHHVNYHQKMYCQWEKLLTMLREVDQEGEGQVDGAELMSAEP